MTTSPYLYITTLYSCWRTSPSLNKLYNIQLQYFRAKFFYTNTNNGSVQEYKKQTIIKLGTETVAFVTCMTTSNIGPITCNISKTLQDTMNISYLRQSQSLRSGCLIHNGTYLTLSLTLTITLTLLTLPLQ